MIKTTGLELKSTVKHFCKAGIHKSFRGYRNTSDFYGLYRYLFGEEAVEELRQEIKEERKNNKK